jgi:hypothetical protein
MVVCGVLRGKELRRYWMWLLVFLPLLVVVAVHVHVDEGPVMATGTLCEGRRCDAKKKGDTKKGDTKTADAKNAAPKERAKRRSKMPLIVVANSPDKEAALSGLKRWKAAHPDAPSRLAVDDVLVDSMRGQSSTWTRIRINLRNVPEETRPAQETPDPDEDPTRAWREARRCAIRGA